MKPAREQCDTAAAPEPRDESQAQPHTSDHLANERTFLAWIRTSIAVIGLGFVVAKFSVWLRELAVRLNETDNVRHSGVSLPLGVGMMSIGGVLAVTAAWRYRRIQAAIEQGRPAASERTMVAVTLMVVAIAVVLVIYMLKT